MSTNPQSRRHPHRYRMLLLAALLLAVGAPVLQAQDAAPAAADPPARVARLSYMAGDLGLLPAGANDWVDARVNRPLTTGDRLSSGSDARAELELGGARLRIDANTDVGLLDLNQELAQIELTQGTLNLSVHGTGDGQGYEIDTPTIALVLDGAGVYRVDIDVGGNATSVTAFRGDATAYGENGVRQLLHAGKQYEFADASLAVVKVSDIRGEDSFDYWCADRDDRYADANADQYVSDDMVGAQDLGQYGDWQDDADYGQVWYPDDVAADWAPYQDGQWTWIDPWGWTWVDAAPWGFAPFHYGRWAYVRNRWGWIPGPRDERAIYAPALVAFVGGDGWHVSIGAGVPIGWFPLGPGDIYFPWYRSSRDYYSRVNISNIHRHDRKHRRDLQQRLERDYGVYQKPRPLRDIHYANRNAPHAYSVVSATTFAAGRPVRSARLRMTAESLHGAPVLGRGAEVQPQAQARGSQVAARIHRLPLAGFERSVVARHAPPSAAALDLRNGSARKPTVSAGIVPPRAHVRVLGDPVRRSAAADPRNAQSAPAPRQRPAAAKPTPARVRDGAMVPHLEALRSSRFAHPPASRSEPSRAEIHAPGGQPGSRGAASERPDVSFIGAGNGHAPVRQRLPSANHLPPVPVLHRAVQAAPSPQPRPQRFTPAGVARAQQSEIQFAPRPARTANRPGSQTETLRSSPPVRTFHPTPRPPAQAPTQRAQSVRIAPARKSPPPASSDDDSEHKRRWKH